MVNKQKTIFLILIIFPILFSSCVFVRLKSFENLLSNKPLKTKDYLQITKFRQDETRIYIDIKVNDEDTSREFILDTGSPCTFFHGCENGLNLKTKPIIHLGRNIKEDYGCFNAKIGNLEYENLAFYKTTSYFKFNQPGFFGVNAMQNSIWSFNFKDSIITITDNIERIKDVSGAYRMSFTPRRKQETPYVQAIINNSDSLLLMFDSGENHFITDWYPEYRKKKFIQNPQDIITCRTNLNLNGNNKKKDSIVVRQTLRISSLRIGNFEMKNVLAEGGLCQFGLDFMKNFTVTFDWMHHFLYLKPNETLNFPTNILSFGFSVVEYKDKLLVNSLFDESKASQNGIKLGDEILSINGIQSVNIDKATITNINNKLPMVDEYIFQVKGLESAIRLKKENLFQ